MPTSSDHDLIEAENRFDAIPDDVRASLRSGSALNAARIALAADIRFCEDDAAAFLSEYRQWRHRPDIAAAMRDNFRYAMRRRRAFRRELERLA